MTILQAQPADLTAIVLIYEQATAYQKTVARKYWKGFDEEMIADDINEKRQWKIVTEDGEIACIFCTAFEDPLIWAEKNADPAVYLHRIATKEIFRGNGFVPRIIEWTKKFANEKGKRFIRMDTGSGNEKLNAYYTNCGFKYLGTTELKNTEGLPQHYKDGSSSLFEIDLSILV